MTFEKAFLTKGKHVIEIERWGSVYLIYKYNLDELQKSKENLKQFIDERLKEGYELTVMEEEPKNL